VDNEEKQHVLSFSQLAMVLAIACAKMSFVLLFFMHLRYQGKISIYPFSARLPCWLC